MIIAFGVLLLVQRDHAAMTRRGVFWPLILIAVGAVGLLVNYGLLSGLSVTALLGLWPLLLILLGIDLAFGRRWPLWTLSADVVVIALAIGLVATQPTLISADLGFSVGSDCDRSDGQPSVSVPRGAATSLVFRFDGGAGRFRIGGGAPDLVNATSSVSGLRLRATGSTGDRFRVRLDDCVARSAVHGAEEVDVLVASDVPASFTVNAGAGDFTIDLGGVKVRDVTLNAGASSVRLVLPTPSGDVPVRIAGGASSVTVEIPDRVEARVTTTGAFMSTNVTNTRVTTNGSRHETAGYAAATDRVSVSVTTAAGSVAIR